MVGRFCLLLRDVDFYDDSKDAGAIGAGHDVTALWELVPLGAKCPIPQVGDLKYQQPRDPTPAGEIDELLTVTIRYKRPDEAESRMIAVPLTDSGESIHSASNVAASSHRTGSAVPARESAVRCGPVDAGLLGTFAPCATCAWISCAGRTNPTRTSTRSWPVTLRRRYRSHDL
jgi:hypothetical protein